MVTFHTNHGDIVIKTFDDKAPETVKNFLDYCREGFYDNTIFHRVINGFMIQGGGFEPGMKQKATKSPIQNEANNGLKNTRGTLCTDDQGYLAFRAKVHTPWIQRLFLALPLFVRRRIAARMRADSKAANSSKSMEIMDVNPQAVVNAMERHHVQWLIHGHTHRPAVHDLQANGQPAWRVVLGAWHSEGSMVKVTPDDVELIHFPF